MTFTNGLVRKYDKLLALGGLNLEVPSGELFGFIGLNGGGKINIIKLLAALIKPSLGTIHIDDVDIKQDAIRIKNIIGDIPDRPVLYHKLTGWKYPDFIAGLYLMDQDVAREKAGKFFSFFDFHYL